MKRQMQAAALQPAMFAEIGGARLPTRTRTANEKENTNRNSVRVHLVILFSNNTPIMRGVSWALASCTTRRRDEQMKTMKVNIDPATVPSIERTEFGSMVPTEPSSVSNQMSPRASKRPVNRAMPTPRTG